MTTKVTIFKDKREIKVNEVEIPGVVDYEVDYNAIMARPVVRILIRPHVLEVKDK